MNATEPTKALPRWRQVVGSYRSLEQVAADDLQARVQALLPYTLPVLTADRYATGGDHHLLIQGTAADNPLIANLASRGALKIPDAAGGYAVASLASPWQPDRRVVAVAGRDEAGVMYGTSDLCARVLSRYSPHPSLDPSAVADYPPHRRKVLDALPDFAFADYPRVAQRGIWTWGYVIYDYRRFLDNMAHLRMNLLVVWNSELPLNIADIIAYAHGRGIRVILGFHWGWGRDDVDISNPEHRERMRQHVATLFREQYRNLGMDGIYFQTLTEHHDTTIAGGSTAAVATAWVNHIAAGVFEMDPKLLIYFGLHATSIRDRYTELAGLDPRIVIMWEDAGVLPFAYNPLPRFEKQPAVWPEVDSPEATLAYARKLAAFRPGGEFAMVPKGYSWLRWGIEFEHHESMILGRRDEAWTRQRLVERQPFWDYINAKWLRYYPLAMAFYRGILEERPLRVTAAGLIEDGLFEMQIQPSVSIFAQTLWNPGQDPADLLERAMSPYYLRA